MYTEEQKTEAISKCKSFTELEKAVLEYGPFISYSRELPVEWDSQKVLRSINYVMQGNDIAYVTRANGIRDKVIELASSIYCTFKPYR